MLGLCIYGIMWKNIIPYFCVSDMKRTFDDAVRLTEIFLWQVKKRSVSSDKKITKGVFISISTEKVFVVYTISKLYLSTTWNNIFFHIYQFKVFLIGTRWLIWLTNLFQCHLNSLSHFPQTFLSSQSCRIVSTILLHLLWWCKIRLNTWKNSATQALHPRVIISSKMEIKTKMHHTNLIHHSICRGKYP